MSVHVELHTSLHTAPLCGYVINLNQSQAVLHILSPSEEMQAVVSGMEAQLRVSSSAGCYIAGVKIESIERQTLTVALSTSFSCQQRRKHKRVHCAWLAMLRGVHPDGSYGAWKPVQMVDFSEGGLSLVTASLYPIQMCEMRIELKEASGGRQYDDSGSVVNNPPSQIVMHIKANLKHHREVPGGVQIGLAFCGVTPQDKLKITRLFMMLNTGS